MKYFITAKFLRYLNLWICKYQYILCYEEKTETMQMTTMCQSSPPQSLNWGFRLAIMFWYLH